MIFKLKITIGTISPLPKLKEEFLKHQGVITISHSLKTMLLLICKKKLELEDFSQQIEMQEESK